MAGLEGADPRGGFDRKRKHEQTLEGLVSSRELHSAGDGSHGGGLGIGPGDSHLLRSSGDDSGEPRVAMLPPRGGTAPSVSNHLQQQLQSLLPPNLPPSVQQAGTSTNWRGKPAAAGDANGSYSAAMQRYAAAAQQYGLEAAGSVARAHGGSGGALQALQQRTAIGYNSHHLPVHNPLPTTKPASHYGMADAALLHQLNTGGTLGLAQAHAHQTAAPQVAAGSGHPSQDARGAALLSSDASWRNLLAECSVLERGLAHTATQPNPSHNSGEGHGGRSGLGLRGMYAGGGLGGLSNLGGGRSGSRTGPLAATSAAGAGGRRQEEGLGIAAALGALLQHGGVRERDAATYAALAEVVGGGGGGGGSGLDVAALRGTDAGWRGGRSPPRLSREHLKEELLVQQVLEIYHVLERPVPEALHTAQHLMAGTGLLPQDAATQLRVAQQEADVAALGAAAKPKEEQVVAGPLQGADSAAAAPAVEGLQGAALLGQQEVATAEVVTAQEQGGGSVPGGGDVAVMEQGGGSMPVDSATATAVLLERDNAAELPAVLECASVWPVSPPVALEPAQGCGMAPDAAAPGVDATAAAASSAEVGLAVLAAVEEHVSTPMAEAGSTCTQAVAVEGAATPAAEAGAGTLATEAVDAGAPMAEEGDASVAAVAVEGAATTAAEAGGAVVDAVAEEGGGMLATEAVDTGAPMAEEGNASAAAVAVEGAATLAVDAGGAVVDAVAEDGAAILATEAVDAAVPMEEERNGSEAVAGVEGAATPAAEAGGAVVDAVAEEGAAILATEPVDAAMPVAEEGNASAAAAAGDGAAVPVAEVGGAVADAAAEAGTSTSAIETVDAAAPVAEEGKGSAVAAAGDGAATSAATPVAEAGLERVQLRVTAHAGGEVVSLVLGGQVGAVSGSDNTANDGASAGGAAAPEPLVSPGALLSSLSGHGSAAAAGTASVDAKPPPASLADLFSSRPTRKSRYRGVEWDRSVCKWRARITHKGKKISLGSYPSECEAARVYNDMALKLKGDSAQLNQITEEEEKEEPPPIDFDDDAVVSKSGFRGVTWDRRENRWRARITYHGKHKAIGRYSTEHAAALAYDKMAITLLGDRARTNFDRRVVTSLLREELKAAGQGAAAVRMPQPEDEDVEYAIAAAAASKLPAMLGDASGGVGAGGVMPFKGVTWDKRGNVWHARVYMDVKQKQQGSFQSPDHVGATYQDAVKAQPPELQRLEQETGAGTGMVLGSLRGLLDARRGNGSSPSPRPNAGGGGGLLGLSGLLQRGIASQLGTGAVAAALGGHGGDLGSGGGGGSSMDMAGTVSDLVYRLQTFKQAQAEQQHVTQVQQHQAAAAQAQAAQQARLLDDLLLSRHLAGMDQSYFADTQPAAARMAAAAQLPHGATPYAAAARAAASGGAADGSAAVTMQQQQLLEQLLQQVGRIAPGGLPPHQPPQAVQQQQHQPALSPTYNNQQLAMDERTLQAVFAGLQQQRQAVGVRDAAQYGRFPGEQLAAALGGGGEAAMDVSADRYDPHVVSSSGLLLEWAKHQHTTQQGGGGYSGSGGGALPWDPLPMNNASSSRPFGSM